MIQEPIIYEIQEPQPEPARHRCARCCMTFRIANGYVTADCKTRCGDCGIPFVHTKSGDNPAICRIDPATYAAWMAGEAV